VSVSGEAKSVRGLRFESLKVTIAEAQAATTQVRGTEELSEPLLLHNWRCGTVGRLLPSRRSLRPRYGSQDPEAAEYRIAVVRPLFPRVKSGQALR
jgi:hypothetical protein